MMLTIFHTLPSTTVNGVVSWAMEAIFMAMASNNGRYLFIIV